MKNRFSRWLGLPIGMILALFDLQVTPMFLIKFRVNWPLVQKRKIHFKMAAMAAILDSDWNDFSNFFLQVTPKLPTKFGVSWPFSSGAEAENRFSRWLPWGHLGFPIGMILAIFDLQVTPMLPTKFRVNWPYCSGEEAKNRFSRWRPSWISYRNDFSYFLSTSHCNASYQVLSQLALGCRSRLLKQNIDASRCRTDDSRCRTDID